MAFRPNIKESPDNVMKSTFVTMVTKLRNSGDYTHIYISERSGVCYTATRKECYARTSTQLQISVPFEH